MGAGVFEKQEQDKTKKKKVETIPVLVFIGRMVHRSGLPYIVPKWFHRFRYYGLQATKTLKKWKEAIEEGLRNPSSPV